MEKRFNIYSKSPATNWHIIHRDWDLDSTRDFMQTMGEGGYNKSGTDAECDLENLTARLNNGGDLIQFRASEIERDEDCESLQAAIAKTTGGQL